MRLLFAWRQKLKPFGLAQMRRVFQRPFHATLKAAGELQLEMELLNSILTLPDLIYQRKTGIMSEVPCHHVISISSIV